MTVLNESVSRLLYEDRIDFGDGDNERPRPAACIYASKFHELADKYDCPVKTKSKLSYLFPLNAILRTKIAAEASSLASIAGKGAGI